MGFKVERPKDDEAPKALTPWALLGALLFCLVVAWGVKQAAFPEFDACERCMGTGALSCGAEGCAYGQVRCTASCLKLDDPGWQHLEVEGHPASDLWMRFDNDDGGWTAWTQNHRGELIEKVDGHWVNKGPCPVCHGSGRMTCPVCQGKKRCPICDGEGKLRRWSLW